MSRDEIINMAREAGVFTPDGHCATVTIEVAERFAAMVAAAEREARQAAQIENEALKARIARADVELQRAVIAEREACAKVCEDAISSIWEFHPEYVNQVGRNVCTNLAAAIRARGAA